MDWLKETKDTEWYELGSFQLFGLPLQLEIDENVLEKRYISITQKAHPDRNEERQDWALLLTSRVNQAYEELANFRSRAELFFKEKKGNRVDSTQDRLLPTCFLEQVFIWNEQLEANQLDMIEVEDALDTVEDELLKIANTNDWSADSYRKQLNKLKYLENLVNTEGI